MQLSCPQIPSEACLLQKRWWRKQFASSELKESSSQHHYFSKSLTKTSMSMLIFANSFKSTAIPFSIFFLSLSSILDLSIFSFFFLSPQLSVWTLLSSPTLTAPVLTSHFWFPPVNLNTGQVFPPAQISALKGTDSPHCWALTLFFSAYFQSSGLFLTHAEHEEMTDEHFWSFTFSESSVTSTILDLHDFIQRFEWKPAYDASLRVMWHLKDPKICHYEWTPCVNVGHPCLISHFINWKVKAQYGYSWLSNQEPIRPWLHKGLLWHFATFAATFSLRFHIFVSVL